MLGYIKGKDVSIPISTIVIGIASSNAYQKKGEHDKKEDRNIRP